jgi:predicted transposase/invertase (TIGR01784 family)
MSDKYINPFTDFGFKKIFGEEANKDLLMDFLNQLLPERGVITDLVFLKTEQLGANETDRKAIYDLYCTNGKGEKFIIELQKAKQKYFKDRSLYYSTFAIQEQAQKGDWDYELQGVYTIAVMDFLFLDTSVGKTNVFRHDVQLMEIHKKEVFYDKLLFIYLEMPNFTKTLAELENNYEKWLYVLKNISSLEKMPDLFKGTIFSKIFDVAEIAKYGENEQRAYQDSLKYYRDLKNVMTTKYEEGIKEGIKVRNIEIAQNLKNKGFNVTEIAELTGLTEQEIKGLK